MSYEIVYKKSVINLPNGMILPIIQSGSNNTYDEYNRRERRWTVPKFFVGTKDQIKAEVKEMFQPKIDDNDRGYSEENWLEMESKRWIAWKFPGRGDARGMISYLSNVNIKREIAEHHIRIDGKKISEIDRDNLEKNGWFERVTGVDSALGESRMIKENERLNKPKRPKKEKLYYIVFDKFYTPMRATGNGIKYMNGGIGKRFTTMNEAKKRAEKYIEPLSKIDEYEIKKDEKFLNNNS